jgi:GntR family transcriptional repressor for pyruvate dehydrogenase complex
MELYLRGSEIPYEHVHEARRTLEAEVAGLAAERATDEAIVELTTLHERLVESGSVGDGEEFALLDVEFHRQLARITGNEVFGVLLDSIRRPLLEVRRALSANRDAVVAEHDRAVTERAHGQILNAVASRDPEAARAAMSAHLAAVYDALAQTPKAGPTDTRRDGKGRGRRSATAR